MNRYSFAAAAVSASLFLAGCSSAGSSTAAGSSASSSDDDTFRVGMECNYAPFNWTTGEANDTTKPLDDGSYCDGYDVVIAERMAESLGKTLEVHKLDWDNLILSLNNDQIDAVIAGMTATPEREEQINFTDPYYESEEVIIVRDDSQYKDATDIQDFSGAKLVGQMNTIYDEVIDQIDGVQHQQAASDFPAAVHSLVEGEVDGVVSELPVANGVVAANSGLTIVRFADGHNFEADTTVSIGVRKSDTELQEQLNSALAEISTDERNQLMEEAVDRQPANE